MITLKKFHYKLVLTLCVSLTLILTSCSSDDDATLTGPPPTISNIEVGLHNNEIGVIGEDFHFNAEVLAGDLLDNVQINIEQKPEETYENDWTLEVVFTERIQGVKNVTLHRHFDIPSDAPRGLYNFIITVNDQNGSSVEEIREINIIDASDYPEVTPYVSVFGIDKKNVDGTSGFNNFYNNGAFKNPDAAFF